MIIGRARLIRLRSGLGLKRCHALILAHGCHGAPGFVTRANSLHQIDVNQPLGHGHELDPRNVGGVLEVRGHEDESVRLFSLAGEGLAGVVGAVVDGVARNVPPLVRNVDVGGHRLIGGPLLQFDVVDHLNMGLEQVPLRNVHPALEEVTGIDDIWAVDLGLVL